MRDMVQNHLMQLMAFAAMEAPAVFEPEPMRDEIVKVFRSLRPYTAQRMGSRHRAGAIPGIPRGKGRFAGLDDRDVRRDEILHR